MQPPDVVVLSSRSYTGLRKNRLSLKRMKPAPVTSMADATGVHDERLPVDPDAPVAPASMPGRRRHGEAA
jgi:hypothetical protein